MFDFDFVHLYITSNEIAIMTPNPLDNAGPVCGNCKFKDENAQCTNPDSEDYGKQVGTYTTCPEHEYEEEDDTDTVDSDEA